MARTRSHAGMVPARQRMIDTFWQMLSEGGYEGITVRTRAAECKACRAPMGRA